jgi:branched-chain amino acid transport system substrate-binding protein
VIWVANGGYPGGLIGRGRRCSKEITSKRCKEAEMQNRRLSTRLGHIWIVMVVAFMLLASGWVQAPSAAAADKAPDKIRIGCAIALSGPNSMGGITTQVNPYKLWVADTNKKGGIFVPKYNKRIPVELIIYDDRSDIETCVKMAEKLIVEDKVDFMLPPWGTASNFAIAPVATKYKQPMMGITVSSVQLDKRLASTPYFFVILGQPQRLVPSTVALMQEVGVKSVAVIYTSDLFGLEHVDLVKEYVGKTDIKMPILQSYPPEIQSFSPLIKRIEAEKVDAVLNYGYPPHTFLLNKEMPAMGYNPKFFQNGVGTQFPSYRDAFGAAGVDGVFGQWALTPKMPYPGAKEFFEGYKKMFHEEAAMGGEPGAYASLQILEQAIKKVGDLNREKIRDVIATDTFDTVMGPVRFEKGINVQWPGNIGQWQKGVYEVVMPKEFRTAAPIYPKPNWPAPK